MAEIDPATLMICPACDAVHARAHLAEGQTARCTRCGDVIGTRKPQVVDRLLAASLAMLALVASAAFLPFLTLREAGLQRTVSLWDAAAALDATLAPLGALLLLAVLGLPAARAAAHLWALGPWRLGLGLAPGAATVFRWSSRLRVWAMAEIFMIGVAVSMVKVAGLAHLDPGPAFYALGGAVVVIGFENAAACRETVWAILSRDRASVARGRA